jgi:FkbM family methyltransferase
MSMIIRKFYHVVFSESIRRKLYLFRKKIKKTWEKIVPPVVVLNEYLEKGCKFEITTKTEKIRVMSIGNEREFFESFLSVIEPTDVIFDIGSCVGLYAIHAGVMEADVFAFEPDPGYRKRLRKNIRINRLIRRIKVVSWAVSNKKDQATLYTDGVDGKSPSLGLVGERGSVNVDTNTLDNAIREGELPKPTLLKMDIEGAEVLALQGMTELLSSKNAPRAIFIEIHPELLGNFGSSSRECIELIETYGYKQKRCVERDAELHCIYKKVRGENQVD